MNAEEPPRDEAAAAAAAAAVMKSLEDAKAVAFFEKQLTSSDASGSGRVVIPKAIAEQYFPKLETQVGVPVEATDTFGNKYNFRFRFWINNQSRMYLLEGAGELHSRYNLKTGDVMIFGQLPDGALIVAGRPSTKKRALKPGERLPDAQKKKKKQHPAEADLGRYKLESANHCINHGPQVDYNKQAYAQPLEAPVDGIFRALLRGISQEPSRIIPSKNGRSYTAVINLAGELYQAHFECLEDAVEAFNAAGFVYSRAQ